MAFSWQFIKWSDTVLIFNGIKHVFDRTNPIGKNVFNICTMFYVKMLHSTITTEMTTFHSSEM